MNQKLKLIIILFTVIISINTTYSQTACPTDIGLKDVFVVAKGQGYGICRDYILHEDVTFHFADIFVPGAFISADFGDGNGFISLFANQKTINYSSIGEKDIEFRQTFISSNGGPGYTSHYRMKLTIVQTYGNYISPDEVWEITVDPSITWTPPCSDAYPTGSPFLNATIDRANAYIKYGAGHTELVRPLIFIDGLDFGTKTIIDPNVGNQPIRNGGTGWDVFIMGSSESFYDPEDYSEFQRYPSQFSDILAASYDIVFLDFKNGSDYIQKNSLLLQELLLQVNALKVADPNTGILHQNVVVGASMGGQIAKYTLAKMEADGIPHCSSDYLSFDSPHQGANIAMGLQAAAWYFNRTSSQKSLWENLNAPASRQLLIQNFGGEVQNGNLGIKNTLISGTTDVAPPNPDLDFNCLRDDFVQTMEYLGYPIETRNTAISCGSETAINQGYTRNAHLFKGRLFVGNLGTVFNLDLWGNQSSSYYHTVNTLKCTSTSATITQTNIDENNSIFAAESPSETDECFSNNAPGCFRSDLFSLRKEIKEILEAENTGIVTSEILNNRVQQCFMPTMSTLDIDWEMDDVNMNRSIITENIIENNLTRVFRKVCQMVLIEDDNFLIHVFRKSFTKLSE